VAAASEPAVPPLPPTELTRARMRCQPRTSTGPEMALRRELHARGLRYRVDAPVLPGLRRRADLLFVGSKVAVFVDGCFWHGCPVHSRPTRSNTGWWASKLAANRRRDEETTTVLTSHGWSVQRFWEHENHVAAADRVVAEVRARSTDRPAPVGRRGQAQPTLLPASSPASCGPEVT